MSLLGSTVPKKTAEKRGKEVNKVDIVGRDERGTFNYFDLLGLYWFIPANTQVVNLVTHTIEAFNCKDIPKSSEIFAKNKSTYQRLQTTK